MGKKKGKVYKGMVLMVLCMALVFGLASFAVAEQQFYPGFVDVEGELGTNGKSWRIGHINTLVGEGTSDANETYIYFVDPSGTNVILVPDSSGTIALTGDIASTITLADTQILVGQSTGLGAAKAISGDSSITNAGAMTNDKIDNKAVDFGDETDGHIQVATDAPGAGTGSWDSVAHTLTGDVTGTMANSGAIATTLNLNTVTINIAGGDLFTKVEVETGSELLGWYIGNYGAINQVTFANAPLWIDPDVWVSINGTDTTQQTTFVLQFLKP